MNKFLSFWLKCCVEFNDYISEDWISLQILPPSFTNPVVYFFSQCFSLPDKFDWLLKQPCLYISFELIIGDQ